LTVTDSGDFSGLRKQLWRHLTNHGHVFQTRALREANAAFEQQPNWAFEVSEFPVQARGIDTHIDFVLTDRSGQRKLIVECKRSDPSRWVWAFWSVPNRRRNSKGDRLTVSRILAEGAAHPHISGVSQHPTPGRYAHHATVLKQSAAAINDQSSEAGNPKENDRRAIDDAADQVLIGVNGMLAHLAEFQKHRAKPHTDLIPVIVTTAPLVFGSVEHDEADIAAGMIPADAITVTSENWIVLQRHMTRRVKFAGKPFREQATLGDVLDDEFVRSIIVVHAPKFSEFLARFGSDYFDFD
jgi:hypothetical protein